MKAVIRPFDMPGTEHADRAGTMPERTPVSPMGGGTSRRCGESFGVRPALALAPAALPAADVNVGGELKPRVRVYCGRCNGETAVRGYIEEAKVALRAKGWKLGDTPYGHLCPTCNNAAALVAAAEAARASDARPVVSRTPLGHSPRRIEA